MHKMTVGAMMGLMVFGMMACTSEPSNEFKVKFQSLVEKSVESELTCKNYEPELKKAGVTTDIDSQVGFKDRSTALSVLKLLALNPGVSPATQEAARLIHTQSMDKLENEWFVQNVGKLQPYCSLASLFVNLKTLIKGVEKYKLTSSERMQVKALAFKFIQTESSYPCPLVSSLVQISLLEEMNAAGMLGTGKNYGLRINDLDREGKEVMKKVAEKSRQIKGNTDKERAPEAVFRIFEAEKFRKKVNDLFLDIHGH